MANYIDYLMGNEALAPSNYVQPLSDQPLVSPYEAALEIEPVSRSFGAWAPGATAPALQPRNMDMPVGDFTNQLLEPSVKPVIGKDIDLVPNPNRDQGNVTLPAVQSPSVDTRMALGMRGDTSEADRAIGALTAGKRQFLKDIAQPPQGFGEYQQYAQGADAAYQQLDTETNAYETAADNILAQQKEAQDKYQQDVVRINNSLGNTVQDIEKEMRALTDEKIDTSIDPGKYWANLGTGNKIAMAIGMIFAAMTPETTKLAINSLQTAIDRDVDAQKQNILTKMADRREKLTAGQQRLENVYKKTNSQLALVETMKARSYQYASMMLDNASKKLTNRESLVNAQTARAQLKMNALTAQQNAINAAVEQQNKKAELALDASKSEALIRMEKAKMVSDQLIAASKGIAGQGAVYGDPLGAEMSLRIPEKRMEKAIEERGVLEANEAMIDGLRKFYERAKDMSYGDRIWALNPYSDEGAFIKTAPIQVFQIGTTLSKGAVQQHEFDSIIKPLLPSIADSDDAMTLKMNTAIQSLTRLMMGKTPTLRTYGVDAVKYYPQTKKVVEDFGIGGRK